MLRKLAVALVAFAALASPALAAQRGLPDQARCTHCLPSAVTGGPAAPVRGRAVARAQEEAPVRTATQPPAARKVARAEARPTGRVAVSAECGCAQGACPMHG